MQHPPHAGLGQLGGIAAVERQALQTGEADPREQRPLLARHKPGVEALVRVFGGEAGAEAQPCRDVQAAEAPVRTGGGAAAVVVGHREARRELLFREAAVQKMAVVIGGDPHLHLRHAPDLRGDHDLGARGRLLRRRRQRHPEAGHIPPIAPVLVGHEAAADPKDAHLQALGVDQHAAALRDVPLRADQMLPHEMRLRAGASILADRYSTRYRCRSSGHRPSPFQ